MTSPTSAAAIDNALHIYLHSKSHRKVYPDKLDRLHTRNLIYHSTALPDKPIESSLRDQRYNRQSPDEVRRVDRDLVISVNSCQPTPSNTNFQQRREEHKVSPSRPENITSALSHSFTYDEQHEPNGRNHYDRQNLNRSLVGNEGGNGVTNTRLKASITRRSPPADTANHALRERVRDLQLETSKIALENNMSGDYKITAPSTMKHASVSKYHGTKDENSNQMDALDELKADVLKSRTSRLQQQSRLSPEGGHAFHSSIEPQTKGNLNLSNSPQHRGSSIKNIGFGSYNPTAQYPSGDFGGVTIDGGVLNSAENNYDYFKADIEQQRYRKKLEDIASTQEKNYQQFMKQIQLPQKDAAIRMKENLLAKEEEINYEKQEFDNVKIGLKKAIKNNYRSHLDEQLNEKSKKEEQKELEKKEMMAYSNEQIIANSIVNDRLKEMKITNQKNYSNWLKDQHLEKIVESNLLKSPHAPTIAHEDEGLPTTTIQNLNALKYKMSLPITGMRNFSPTNGKALGESRMDRKYKDSNVTRKISNMNNPVLNAESIGCTSPYIIRDMYTNAYKQQNTSSYN